MKYCSKCDTNKLKKYFAPKSDMSDGLQTYCMKCNLDISKAYYRTKKGLSARIYNRQKSSSKQRKHNPPNYSLAEFRVWLFSQENFAALYVAWALSEYDKNKTPSADRINDYTPYTLDNLKLMTWQENNAKSHIDRINGINTKASKAVLQISKNDVVIASHFSTHQAAKITGAGQSHIVACCKGVRNTAGGFSWRYA